MYVYLLPVHKVRSESRKDTSPMGGKYINGTERFKLSVDTYEKKYDEENG